MSTHRRMPLTIGAIALTCASVIAGLASVRAQAPQQAPAPPAARTPPALPAGSAPAGPSPYDVIRGWHKPFSEPGFAFGGNSGVFAESPDRILVAQRGETRLPDPLPAGFAGFAGSIGINVLNATERRVWRNCLYTLDANGRVKERWTQWDSLCRGIRRTGPHRLRISPYIRSTASGW